MQNPNWRSKLTSKDSGSSPKEQLNQGEKNLKLSVWRRCRPIYSILLVAFVSDRTDTIHYPCVFFCFKSYGLSSVKLCFLKLNKRLRCHFKHQIRIAKSNCPTLIGYFVVAFPTISSCFKIKILNVKILCIFRNLLLYSILYKNKINC